MKTIAYSIIREDIAQYYFLKRLLEIVDTGVNFELHEACYNRYKDQCTTRKSVINKYADIANQAFRTFTFDVLFVFTDHDDDQRTSPVYHKDLQKGVASPIIDRVIISIPMRCIEHWLRYLQWISDHPAATKNISMENEMRNESKVLVFGAKKTSEDKTKATIDILLVPDRIPRLITLCPSFNILYEQIKKLS